MKIENSIASSNLLKPTSFAVSFEDQQQEETVRNDFQSVWNTISDMNQKQNQSQSAMEDVITGVSDDHHGAMIGLQKAAFSIFLQISFAPGQRYISCSRCSL